MERILSKNWQNLVKIIKLVVDKNNPKQELNYLYFDSLNKRLVACDTLSLLVIDTEIDMNEDKYIAINESSKRIVYEDKSLTYPNYERVIPQTFTTYNNIYEMIQDSELKFPIYNKRIQSILTNIRDFKDITNVRYCVSTTCTYMITFNYLELNCKLVIMSGILIEKRDIK